MSKIKLTQNFVNNLYLGLKEKFGEKNAKEMLNNYLNCYKDLKIIKKNFLVIDKNCNFIFPLKTGNKLITINFKQNVIKISPFFIKTFFNKNKIKTTKKTFKQILINHQLKKIKKAGKQEKNKNVVKLDQNPFFTTKKMVKNKTIKIKKSKMPVNMELQKEINVSMLKQLVSEYNPTNVKEHNLTSVINQQNKENHSSIDIIHKQLNNKKEKRKNAENFTPKILKQSKEAKLSLKQKDNNNTKISNTSTNIVVKKSKTIKNNNHIFLNNKIVKIKNTTIPNNSNKTKDNNSNVFLYIVAILVLIVITYFVGIYYKRKKKNKSNNVVENKKTEEKNSNKKAEYTDNKDDNKEIKYIGDKDVEVEKINENKDIKVENLQKEQEDGKCSEDNENNKTITTSTELITFFGEKKEQLEEIIIKAGKYTYIKKLKNFEKLKKEQQ